MDDAEGGYVSLGRLSVARNVIDDRPWMTSGQGRRHRARVLPSSLTRTR